MPTCSMNTFWVAAVPPCMPSTTMTSALPATFWAECGWPNGPNTLAGIEAIGNTLSYGTINANGAYVVQESGAIPTTPAGLAPSGLLSNDPWGGFFAALYPSGSSNGVLAYGIFRPNTTIEFHALNYALTGAAVIY